MTNNLILWCFQVFDFVAAKFKDSQFYSLNCATVFKSIFFKHPYTLPTTFFHLKIQIINSLRWQASIAKTASGFLIESRDYYCYLLISKLVNLSILLFWWGLFLWCWVREQRVIDYRFSKQLCLSEFWELARIFYELI